MKLGFQKLPFGAKSYKLHILCTDPQLLTSEGQRNVLSFRPLAVFSALIHFCQMTETSRYTPQSMNYKVIATLLHTHIYTETVLMELFTRFFRGTQNEKLQTMVMLLFSI